MNYLHFKLLLIVISALGAHAASGMQECKERKATAEAAAETKQAVETKTAADASSADAKSSAQAQGEITVVKIHIPEDISKKGAEELQLDEDESLTYETFRELINKQAKTGDSFILARVVSQKSGDETEFVHYYDAHTLNRHIFGAAYAKSDEMQMSLIEQTNSNPLNKLPIKRIDYFYCYANKLSEGFVYLGEKRFLFEPHNTVYINLFYANQNIDRTTKVAALENLKKPIILFGAEYPKSPTPGPIFNHNLPALILLSEQTTNIELRIQARAILGLFYITGVGFPKSYTKALEYYLPNVQQVDDLFTKYMAMLNVSNIYAKGDNEIKADHAKAIMYLIECAEQKDIPYCYCKALTLIGAIYQHAHLSIQKDYAKASYYFEQACMLSEVLDTDARHNCQTTCLFSLALMHNEGGYGIEKDAQKAVQFLKMLLQKEILAPELQKTVSDKISALEKALEAQQQT